MKNFEKNHDVMYQNETNVKKSQKHDANLQKNSTLYFQVGLILCLLGTYGLFEMRFETKAQVITMKGFEKEPDVINFIPVIEIPKVKKTIKKTKPARLIDKYVAVPDDTANDFVPDVIIDLPTQNIPDLDLTKLSIEQPPEKADPIPITIVENVPVFPGCEFATTNQERKQCMSKKIAKHIKRKFNTDVASGLGLEGVQRINVVFKIDQNGDVTEIQARSPHKQLRNEAEKVISKLPKMTPGKQKDKNVSVIYVQPIIFNIQN